MERIKVGNKYIAERYTDQYGKVYIRLKYNGNIELKQLCKSQSLREYMESLIEDICKVLYNIYAYRGIIQFGLEE